MAEGRLKVGSNFLKIGGRYLRIGPAPNSPLVFSYAPTEAASVSGANLANGSLHAVTVPHPEPGTAFNILMSMSYDTKGADPTALGPPDDSVVTGSVSWTQLEMLTDTPGTGPNRFAVWGASLPAGQADFSVSFTVDGPGTAVGLTVYFLAIKTGDGLNVVQSVSADQPDMTTLALPDPFDDPGNVGILANIATPVAGEYVEAWVKAEYFPAAAADTHFWWKGSQGEFGEATFDNNGFALMIALFEVAIA